MPIFKSTYNILTKIDEDEVFDPNWMDSDKLVLPPKKPWTYDKEMTIEDVDIWEVLFEHTGGIGVYAAWCPYAEFYLITTGIDKRYGPRYESYDNLGPVGAPYWDRTWEVFYGKGAQQKVLKKCREMGIKLNVYNTWVKDEDLWLYEGNPIHSN